MPDRARADALFELGDALLCHSGPVASLPGLSLAGVFGRGHGELDDALNSGTVDADRLRHPLAGRPIGRVRGRIVLTVDITARLHPDANCSPGRLYCHVTGHGRGQDQMVPGWAYSIIAALKPGPTSWTQILHTQRLGPDDDAAEITAVHVRSTVKRLLAAGQHRRGDAPIAVVVDTGYDVPRLAFQQRDLPVVVIGRLRSDPVLYRAPPAYAGIGRPQRHGAPFRLPDPSTWATPEAQTLTDTDRYGKLAAQAWESLHPWRKQHSAWIDHDQTLPVIESTVIRLQSERLPHTGTPEPAWLWTNARGINDELLDRLRSARLRRFDIKHTYRILKQTLGRTSPQDRDPEAADHWTWLIIAAFTQLAAARPLTADLRLPRDSSHVGLHKASKIEVDAQLSSQFPEAECTRDPTGDRRTSPPLRQQVCVERMVHRGSGDPPSQPATTRRLGGQHAQMRCRSRPRLVSRRRHDPSQLSYDERRSGDLADPAFIRVIPAY